jgi:carboxyl-terminal processing protease
MSSKDIMKRLKGPKGTQVELKVQRRSSPALLTFRIIRDKIPIYSLDASFMVDKQTGYIKLNRFGSTTGDEFRQAFQTLKNQGMKSLILDLQSNGGGLMSAAVDLADEFLAEGQCIVYTEGKHSPRMQSNATKSGLYESGKLIILIDEYSASASEILAGAIQDWDRGVLVGRRSFGKGLVQRPLPFPDGSSLKLTVSRYFTPSGRFIQKPYQNGTNYGADLTERFQHGEMIHSDSIHFPDSLKTYTLINHRVIFGGGGIMPDVFVPYDTTKFTPLHLGLSSSGLLNQFVLQYVDLHRKDLLSTYKTANNFIERFLVNDALIEELLKFAESEQYKLTEADKASDKKLLAKQLKAYIARDLWKISDYYRVMWTENESLLKALSIIHNDAVYNTILNGTNNK